jgi:AP2 domain
MRFIPLKPLRDGRFIHFKLAVIDDEDFERVNTLRWCQQTNHGVTYACVRFNNEYIYMHKFIAKTKEKVDHINHDTLNNQKFNLRVVSFLQNNTNRRKCGILTSCYKGVSFRQLLGRFQAEIRRGDGRYYLGLYHDERMAALAYDLAAIRLFGEHSLINNTKLKNICLKENQSQLCNNVR